MNDEAPPSSRVPQPSWRFYTAVGLFTAVVFIIDISVPLGYAAWALYALPLVLATWMPYPRGILFTNVVVTVLTVVGYFLSPYGSEEIGSFNLFLGVSALWIIGLLLGHRMRSEAMLKAYLRRQDGLLSSPAVGIEADTAAATLAMRRMPVQLAMVYGAFSAIWILIGETALVRLVKDPVQLARLEVLMGWLVVVFTMVVIGAVARLYLAEVTQAYERLARGEAHLKAIFSHAPDPIMLLAPGGIIRDVNAAGLTMLGLRGDLGAAVGRVLAPAVTPSHRDELVSCLSRSRRGETVLARLDVEVGRDQRRPMDMSFVPLLDPVGEVGSILVVAHDLTERYRAEETEARLRLLVDSLQDYAIFLIDPEGHVINWNAGAQRVVGYAAAEIIGRDFSCFYPEDMRAAGSPRKALDLALRDGRFEDEGWRLCKDGTRLWANVVLTPVRDRGEVLRGVAVVMRDMSERRRAEEQVWRLNVDLEARVRKRTSELEAVNEELEAFSYSVAHDLRAPLRAISGFAQGLVRDHATRLPADGQQLLDRIIAAAARMGRLIDDLLEFARTARMPMSARSVDVRALVEGAWRTLEKEHANRELELRIDDLPRCIGDEALLGQVFFNLLSNAVKFTKGSSPARIHVGTAGKRDGRHVYFVRDNGVGFDMAHADKLFGVFQRLHPASEYDGTGVGLALVQRIVHRHGGEVQAESQPGRGATFYVELNQSSSQALSASRF